MYVQDHLTLEAVQVLARRQTDAKLFRRFQAIVLALQGRTAPDIASAPGCTPRAVQKWGTRYNQGGPDGLRERPRAGRPPRLTGPELDRFRRRVEAGPQPDEGRATFDGHDDRRLLKDEFDVAPGLQATDDLLHRLRFSSLMPRPQYKDADEQVQRLSKEVVPDQFQAIREPHPDEEVRVHFEDEARFGQQGTLCRVWARRGSRPRGVRQFAEELPAGVLI